MRSGMIGAVLLVTFWAGTAAAGPPAKDLFGAVTAPTHQAPRSIGSYAKGCIAGARALSADGPGWAVMRLSRDRFWGQPELLDFIRGLAASEREVGAPGILVGDMGQPRGGPMRTGHASHQIGLDVDIWLTPEPSRTPDPAARETMGAVSMVRPNLMRVDPGRFGPWQRDVLRRAARMPEVDRIFVNPAIKQALCETRRPAGADAAWLRRLRPWWGHDDHFHVRLRCPAGQPDCRTQEPPPAGDGCGADLAWWFTDEALHPKPPPRPTPPLQLVDLPPACSAVLREP